MLEGDNNLLLALARWLAPELHYGAAFGAAGANAAATAAAAGAAAGQPAAGMSVDELLARNAMAMAGMDPLQGRAAGRQALQCNSAGCTPVYLLQQQFFLLHQHVCRHPATLSSHPPPKTPLPGGTPNTY